MDKFRKLTFTVELLVNNDDIDADELTLRDMAYEMTEGGAVGRVSLKSDTTITKKKMVAALYEFGSDPSFFYLADDGKRTY